MRGDEVQGDSPPEQQVGVGDPHWRHQGEGVAGVIQHGEGGGARVRRGEAPLQSEENPGLQFHRLAPVARPAPAIRTPHVREETGKYQEIGGGARISSRIRRHPVIIATPPGLLAIHYMCRLL